MRCTARTPRSPPPERRRRRGRAPPRRFPRGSNRARTEGRCASLPAAEAGSRRASSPAARTSAAAGRTAVNEVAFAIAADVAVGDDDIEAAPRNSFMNCRQCPHGRGGGGDRLERAFAGAHRRDHRELLRVYARVQGSPGSSTFTPRYTRAEAPSARRADVKPARRRNGQLLRLANELGEEVLCVQAPPRREREDALGGNHEVVRRGGVRDGLEDERARVRGGRGPRGPRRRLSVESNIPFRKPGTTTGGALARGGDGIRATDAIDIGDGGVHAPPSREPRLNCHARASVECAPRWRAREPRTSFFEQTMAPGARHREKTSLAFEPASHRARGAGGGSIVGEEARGGVLCVHAKRGEARPRVRLEMGVPRAGASRDRPAMGVFRRAAPMVGALFFVATLALVAVFDSEVRMDTRCQTASWRLRSASTKDQLRGGRRAVDAALAEMGCLPDARAAVVREIAAGRAAAAAARDGARTASPSVLVDPGARATGVTSVPTRRARSRAARRKSTRRTCVVRAKRRAPRLNGNASRATASRTRSRVRVPGLGGFRALFPSGNASDFERQAYPATNAVSPFPEKPRRRTKRWARGTRATRATRRRRRRRRRRVGVEDVVPNESFSASESFASRERERDARRTKRVVRER